MLYVRRNNNIPLASVLIFTYNQEDFVSKTIESILSQKTTFSFEIIIAEDCSIDKTKVKCIEYHEKHPDIITIVANEENKGLMRNFHETIIEYAKGQYITVCAGDDWWIDECKLQKQVEFLEENREYDLVYTKSNIYLQNERKYSKKTIGYSCGNFEKLILRNGIPALTVCFSKKSFCEYVSEVNPCARFPAEDYPMWIWFSYRKKIHFMDKITTVYRVHSASIYQRNISDTSRLYLIEKETMEIKLFFCKLFCIDDAKILNNLNISYYVSTMYLSSLLCDYTAIKERNKIFIENNLYILYFLSRMYAFCGNNKKCNKMLQFLERILRKIRMIGF